MYVPLRGRAYRGLVFTCSLLLAVILHCGPAIADAGTVRLTRAAESDFDTYTRAPSTVQQAFMRSKFWRMRTYAPYFDSRLSWYGDAWAYQDAYAIYPDSPVVTAHPDWILRDGSGNKLWIQFACNGGSCTQYAADIGNPDFRAWWIAGAKAKLAAGYRGLFIDDVNMAERVSNGYGSETKPLDPRTGQPMNETAWQGYMAAFMAQVRAALPGVELVHNTIWTVGDASADLKQQLDSADYVEIERGFNDSGIVGGSSKFGFQTLMNFIDRRHAAGRHVLLDARADTAGGRLYGLATYFLVNDGGDALANDAQTLPDTFWSGYDVRLGAPLGPRYQSSGVWRRDFAAGTVLANEPGASAKTVTLAPGYRDLDGVSRASVTLGAAAGAVLVRDVAADPAPTATPAPTQTTVDTAPAATPTPAPPSSGTTVPVSAPSTPARTAAKPCRTKAQRRTKACRIRAAAAARHGRVKVRGKVRGAAAGKVKITVQKRHGKRWKTTRKLVAKVGRAGAYSRALTRFQGGTYRVRAAYLGTRAARPSHSAYRRFSLR
jgi:Hypothetical glycosyl hydrolase family 15